ncbi:pantoate--beta-alanine ligase [Taibaiella chishuiensis]|uniref:Pantothenate synthetase n=1 Tax=Taibaiella chishuiensis TaxID=1434707 RepID=A0A2P8D3W0_9BACT|nr:pantoate--beta-alanine ligase [Taibaiella chishuiensis]PSK91913.1 pantoate--beta-alanine ligase [Taibaiella chishuiensis]
MYIFHKSEALKAYLDEQKAAGNSSGFVPTMGALHQGHLSLIRQARTENGIAVCSIFVNPTQFNDPQDLAKYPRTIEADIALLIEAGCDALFLPEVDEVYPDGQQLKEPYDLGYVETVLEGAFRPGHFQGVAQVVERLLLLTAPDRLYLGQKDYQQCMVLKRLIELKQLPVTLHIVPTSREADGLAMSSRNRRLTEPQRALAGLLYQCLVSIQVKKNLQPFAIVQKECREILEKKGFRPDYIQLADADTLELLEEYDANRPVVALIAAFIGDIRLIDNLIL